VAYRRPFDQPALNDRADRWHQIGEYLVVDTGVFITHEQKLEDLDLAALIGVHDRPIRVLLPMVVLDELDGVKARKDHAGWRALYSLALIDKILDDATTMSRIDPDVMPACATRSVCLGREPALEERERKYSVARCALGGESPRTPQRRGPADACSASRRGMR
jgi:hypothetical protein